MFRTPNFDRTQRFVPGDPRPVKPWTRLEFHQCEHCPLRAAESPQCPVAAALDQVVEDSKATISSTRAVITVTTAERSYVKRCATQEGLRSLFGLVMASSGCPRLDWLRPLARFHLPFADADENLFRVLSLQLVRQFLSRTSETLAASGGAIKALYVDVQKVNHAFIKRIRAYCEADADKNAIAALDAYAQLFQYQDAGDYKALRELFFAPYLSDCP